jgi:hypothetical protein
MALDDRSASRGHASSLYWGPGVDALPSGPLGTDLALDQEFLLPNGLEGAVAGPSGPVDDDGSGFLTNADAEFLG